MMTKVKRKIKRFKDFWSLGISIIPRFGELVPFNETLIWVTDIVVRMVGMAGVDITLPSHRFFEFLSDENIPQWIPHLLYQVYSWTV